MKKKILFVALALVLIFPVAVHAQNGLAPYVTCFTTWLWQPTFLPVDVGIAGYTDSPATIVQATVNWGDGSAQISTVSNWGSGTECQGANVTFGTHWTHSYTVSARYWLMMTLQDSQGRTTTIQYGITIGSDPSPGGGSVPRHL